MGTQFANENMEPRVRKVPFKFQEYLAYSFSYSDFRVIQKKKNLENFHFYWFHVIHGNVDNIPTLSLHKAWGWGCY